MALLNMRPDSAKYQSSRLLSRSLIGLTFEAHPVLVNGTSSATSDGSAASEPLLVKMLSIATVPPGCREELIIEYKACAGAKYPHLAEVTSVDFAPGAAVITIESKWYGLSLEDLLTQQQTGKLAPSRALELASQIVAALVHLHDPRGVVGIIVHRNIQPRNILFDDKGIVRIADFAFCRALTAVSLMSPAFGNRRFMSPEALQDLPLDESTDIWSFGCLIIYMLTGEPPIFPPNLVLEQGSIDAAVAQMVKDVRASLEPSVPKDEIATFDFLLGLVGQCMMFDPLDRPAASDLSDMEIIQNAYSCVTEKCPYALRPAAPSGDATGSGVGSGGLDGQQRSLALLKEGIIANNLFQVRNCIELFDTHATKMIELGIEHKSYLVLPMLCRRIVERNLVVSVKPRKGEVVSERTNLMKAAWDGDTEGVKRYLHEAGKLWYDDTALMRAARGGNLHCVKLLLCEMGIQSSGLMTALMYTAQKGHIECLKYLLAESRYCDTANVGALIISVRAGYPECVRLLKDREADIRGNDGKSAYDHACEMPFAFISEERYRRCAKMLAPGAAVSK